MSEGKDLLFKAVQDGATKIANDNGVQQATLNVGKAAIQGGAAVAGTLLSGGSAAGVGGTIAGAGSAIGSGISGIGTAILGVSGLPVVLGFAALGGLIWLLSDD